MARSPRPSALSSVFIVLAQIRIVVVEPDTQRLGEDQHAAFARDGAGHTAAADAGGGMHPPLRAAGHAMRAPRQSRGCAGRSSPSLQRRLVGGERIEAAHEDVEEAVLGPLAFRRPLRQHRLVDALGEGGEDGELAGKFGAQFGQRHVGGLGDIGEAGIHEAALGDERHEGVDDAVARIGRGASLPALRLPLRRGGLLAFRSGCHGITFRSGFRFTSM